MNNKLIAIAMSLLVALPASAMALTAPPAPNAAYIAAQTFQRYASLGVSLRSLATVGSGQTAVPGDTFSHTFTLKNTGTVLLPESDYSDGKVTRLYQSYEFTDPNGNVVQGTQAYAEITTALASQSTTSYTATFPIQSSTPSGSYGVVAILFKVDQTWSTATNAWTTGTGVILDQQGVTFSVSTPTPPPAPTAGNLTTIIGNLFASILCAIKQLFGLAC